MFTNQQHVVYGSGFDTNSSLLVYPLSNNNNTPKFGPLHSQPYYSDSTVSYNLSNTNATNMYGDLNTTLLSTSLQQPPKDKKWYLYSNLASDGSSSLRSSHSSIVTMVSNATNTHKLNGQVSSTFDDSTGNAYLWNANRVVPEYWPSKTSKHYDDIFVAKTPTPSDLTVYNPQQYDGDRLRRSFRYESTRKAANKDSSSNNQCQTTDLYRKCSLPPERLPVSIQTTRPYVQRTEYQSHLKAYDQLYTPKQSELKTSGKQSAFKQVVRKDESKQQTPTPTQHELQLTADFTPQLIKTFQQRTTSYLKRKPSMSNRKPYGNRSLTEQLVKPRIYANEQLSRNLTDITTSSLNDCKATSSSTVKNITNLSAKHPKIDSSITFTSTTNNYQIVCTTTKSYNEKNHMDFYMKDDDLMKFEYQDENCISIRSERSLTRTGHNKKYNTLQKKKKVCLLVVVLIEWCW
jgi:hypothetical protein